MPAFGTETDEAVYILAGLGRRLTGVRAVEAELERRIASGFNVFDYLRKDEYGLSRVVADLLDPSGPHGQGTLFLASFIGLVKSSHPHAIWTRQWRLDDCQVVVTREVAIDTKEPDLRAPRRLDIRIVVEAPNQQPGCIAIENKPYAGDGDNQVNAYRQWLACTYEGQFLLLYLSAHGGRPAANSLPLDARTDGLLTMSYCPVAGIGESDGAELRLKFALTDWLAKCAQLCPVDRLTWFLRDAEAFCHKRFGGTMTTPNEQEEVGKFILDSEDTVRTALAVFETWPTTRNRVIHQFLGRLRDHIGQRIDSISGETAGKLKVGSSFAGSASGDGVWVYRDTWWATGNTRPYVWLAHDGTHPKAWFLTVGLYPSGSGWTGEARLQERLANQLIDGKSHRDWPWFRYLEGDFADWSPLVFRMHTEARQPGKLIEDLGTVFWDFAKVAVSVVDEVLAEQD